MRASIGLPGNPKFLNQDSSSPGLEVSHNYVHWPSSKIASRTQAETKSGAENSPNKILALLRSSERYNWCVFNKGAPYISAKRLNSSELSLPISAYCGINSATLFAQWLW